MNISDLSDEVALEPGGFPIPPAPGTRHPRPVRTLGEVGPVPRVLVKLTVAQSGAVQPRHGEVEVSLCGEVAEEEGGGQ